MQRNACKEIYLLVVWLTSEVFFMMERESSYRIGKIIFFDLLEVGFLRPSPPPNFFSSQPRAIDC